MHSFFLRSSGLSQLYNVELTHRILQQNGTGNFDGQQQQQQSSSDDAYEFVAFLLWYIFLVMCCVIPTCCAYRRRRMLEQRLMDYQNNMQRSNNLFVLSNFPPGPHMRYRTSEQLSQERLVLLREELKATTMTIKAENLEQSQSSMHDKYPIAEKSEPSPGDDAAAVAMENGEVDYTEDCGIVRIPMVDGVSASRAVPGVCTICLCAYEDGDQITWSTEASCQHAFHTECIIQWLAKKEEPRCPVCRQEFCPAAIVNTGESFNVDLERENTFLQSFSHALALSQLYRPYNSEPSTNYDPTRRAAITIQLANLAMENQAPNTERADPVPTPTIDESEAPATNEEPVVDRDVSPQDRS